VQPSSSSTVTVRPVLADLLPGERVRDAVLVGTFAIAIALSAQLAFPLPGTPVPVTGQTFVVLLGAAALGPGRGALGAGLYGLVGLLGVPWFAVTSGASLGYVAGFVAAAWVVGRFARAGWLATWRGAAAAMVVGNLVIYTLGASVLALVVGVGPGAAVAMGVAPFLLCDLVKVAAATALLPATQRLLDR
jgi:biotin transport system substrate-specific component